MTELAEERLAEAKRQREAADFMKGLTVNDELVKPIYHPEAFMLRGKLRAAAQRGDLEKTSCSHPLRLIEGYVDFDVNAKRSDRPVNLFECTVCHSILWLADAWGKDVGDG